MAHYSFSRWRILRENANDPTKQLPVGYNPFTSLLQQQGDPVYFGVHDLSKFYRGNGTLPKLDIGQISPKSGVVVNADPIDQLITVAVKHKPYDLGYHKLEGQKKSNVNPESGMYEIQIPVKSLEKVTHLFGDGEESRSIWLVVDGNTKYQNNLMRAIRKKEIEKSHMSQPLSQMSQQVAMAPMAQQMGIAQNTDPSMEQNPMPDQQGMQNPMPQDLPPDGSGPNPKFSLVGRHVVPQAPLQNAHHDITSYDWYWKYHGDQRAYEYYPE
jgi:hypothetical protein